MPSYFITGVSRGLGYEFLRQLSEDASNTVVGLVRNKAATEDKIASDADVKGRTNIHILQGDLIDYESLKKASEDTAKILSGRLDYIIANAALISEYAAYDGPGTLAATDPAGFEKDLIDHFSANVVGNVHLFGLLIPFVLKGDAKKVITISTGLADDSLTSRQQIELSTSYSVSKAAVNTIVAKYHAQYAKFGVLFMSISPGVIDNGGGTNATEEQQKILGGMFEKFMAEYPHFAGPSTNQEAVERILKVVESSSVEGGNGGSFVSHFGNKQWL